MCHAQVFFPSLCDFYLFVRSFANVVHYVVMCISICLSQVSVLLKWLNVKIMQTMP